MIILAVDNDYIRLYCLLSSLGDGISVRRLNYYTYLLQKAGFDLNYSFRLNVSGIASRSFSRFLESKISKGILYQDAGIVKPTDDSNSLLYNYILSFEELNITKKIKDMLDLLSDDELYLICIVDIMIEDIIKTKGTNSLLNSREFIEHSVQGLCSNYSSENFDSAVNLLRFIKKECSLSE